MTPADVIDRYMGLVVDVVEPLHRRSSSNVSFEDLRSYGVLGLLEAYRRFESDREASFASFAYLRVRGAVLDGLRNQTWSKRHWQLDVEIRAEDSDPAAERTAPPEVPFSTETAVASDDDTSGSLTMLLTDRLDLDALADTDSDAPSKAVERHQQWQYVERAIDELPERQREVLDQYYRRDRSMSEIARDFDCSKSWICRLHRRGLDHVRKTLRRRGVAIDVERG